jgi:hypothetical protein
MGIGNSLSNLNKPPEVHTSSHGVPERKAYQGEFSSSEFIAISKIRSRNLIKSLV